MSIENLRMALLILGAIVAACFLVLLGGWIEYRAKLSTLAISVGCIVLAAILLFVIYAAIVLA